MQPPRQRRGALGDHRGARHRGHAAGTDPDGLPRQGKLLQLQCQGAVLAPDLSGAEPGGLGVHLTLDMAGQARFGPDVEWIETIDYEVDPSRAERFYPAIRKYWPTLPDGALMPSYSGIRPKIVPPAVATQDFLMQGPRDHGVEGLINLFGIESPGLTSSLAIADHVAELANT